MYGPANTSEANAHILGVIKETRVKFNGWQKANLLAPGSCRMQQPEDAYARFTSMDNPRRHGPFYEPPLDTFKDLPFEQNGREVDDILPALKDNSEAMRDHMEGVEADLRFLMRNLIGDKKRASNTMCCNQKYWPSDKAHSSDAKMNRQ